MRPFWKVLPHQMTSLLPQVEYIKNFTSCVSSRLVAGLRGLVVMQFLDSLTAAQKTQLQLCSSLVAVVGCSQRHSLQNAFEQTSGVDAAESPPSWLWVGLPVAMVGGRGGDGGLRLQPTLLKSPARSYSLPPSSCKHKHCHYFPSASCSSSLWALPLHFGEPVIACSDCYYPVTWRQN